VLAELLREGLAMIDDGDASAQRLYWFPAVSASASQRGGADGGGSDVAMQEAGG
jgi:hypothetical protein